MKANELISTLQKLVSEYGDLDVVESYDSREIHKVELTEYSDDKGDHDVIGIELEDE